MPHTPGPWTVPHFARPEVNCNCHYVLCGDHFGSVATVHSSVDDELENGDNPRHEQAVANAHLIAAAPSLYAALEAWEAYLHDLPRIAEDAPEAVQLTFAALAKARGEA